MSREIGKVYDMPLDRDVKNNMRELTDKHPDWTYKRRLAASLNAAREHGNKMPGRKRGKSSDKRTRRSLAGKKKIRRSR